MKYFRYNILLWFILLTVKYHSCAQNFSGLGLGTNYAILDVVSDSIANKIYIGGGFSIAGGIQSHCFAIWDGISWDTTRNQFPSPPTSQIRSIRIFNNKIYVGGTFGLIDTSGIQIGYGLAYWDSVSQSWDSDSVLGFVETLGIYNGDLIIGGNFIGINGVVSNKIIGFNGTNYFPFSDLDTMGGGIAVVQEYNNELYVGGNFDSQVASNMKDIVKWDGSQWLSVGGGLSGFSTFVEAMENYQGKLVIGGWFKEANGDPGNSIAAWDGAQWSQFGTGIPTGGIRCMAVYNNDLWVGGSFSSIGGINVSNIARWDGSTWHNTGLNLQNAVFGMTVYNNELYIAGNFLTVNNDTVNNIIKYNNVTGYSELYGNNDELFHVFPNPTIDCFFLSGLSIDNKEQYFVIISDLNGRIISSEIVIGVNKQLELNISNLNKGVYSIRVLMNDIQLYNQKFIKF